MLLTEEQQSIQEMARRFAQERLAPNAERWDREHHYPADAIAEMAQLGFFGMLVPEEWDGNDSGYVSYAVALEEIAAGNGACSTIMSVHNSVACMPILKFGTDAQKERFLRPLARGEHIGAFALTEPQAGSDASSLHARAQRRDGDGYACPAEPQHHSHLRAATARTVIVFAVTDPEAGKRGISAFIVPTDTPGYKVLRVEDKLGQHASDTCQIAFEDLRIPAEYRLGEEGEGYKIALSNLEGGRIGIASQDVGLARAAFYCARDYARYRQAFGKPIMEHQAVSFRLADMATQIRRGAPDGAACRGASAPRSRPARPECVDGQAVRQRNGRARVQRSHPDPGRLRLSEGFSGGTHLPRRARVPDL